MANQLIFRNNGTAADIRFKCVTKEFGSVIVPTKDNGLKKPQQPGLNIEVCKPDFISFSTHARFGPFQWEVALAGGAFDVNFRVDVREVLGDESTRGLMINTQRFQLVGIYHFTLRYQAGTEPTFPPIAPEKWGWEL